MSIKARYIIFLIIQFLIEFYIVSQYISAQNIEYVRGGVLPVVSLYLGYMGIINFIITVVGWKKLTGEILCPYILLYLTMFVFCYGQCVGWVLNLEMPKDLLLRHHWKDIVNAQGYTLLGMLAFNIGAVFIYSKKRIISRANRFKNYVTKYVLSCKDVGKILFIVSAPIYCIIELLILYNVYNYGYLGYYRVIQSESQFIVFLVLISDYFVPSLLLLIIGNRKNPRIVKTILGVFVLIILLELYIGGRSSAVMLALTILLIYHYMVRPINKKQFLALCVACYMGIIILNITADIRTESSRSVTDVVAGSEESYEPVSALLGELGWSMSSLIYTMEYVPGIWPFRLGTSYVFAPTSIIPNLGFWPVHPAALYSDLATWLRSVLGIDFGPGYTIVAESYINFSWYGLIMMGILGMIITYFLTLTDRKHFAYDIIGMLILLLISTLLIRRLVRSSISASVRILFYTIILIIYFVKTRAKKYSQNRKLPTSRSY